MVGWHHGLNECEFGQVLGDSEGEGSLAYCSPWGCTELDIIELLNNNSIYLHIWGSGVESPGWEVSVHTAAPCAMLGCAGHPPGQGFPRVTVPHGGPGNPRRQYDCYNWGRGAPGA